MTNALIVRTLNDTPVPQRRADGYVNATAMCKAAGKEWSGYIRTQSAQEYVAELTGSLQICRDPVIQSISTGPNELRGTWVHPDVAVHLAS